MNRRTFIRYMLVSQVFAFNMLAMSRTALSASGGSSGGGDSGGSGGGGGSSSADSGGSSSGSSSTDTAQASSPSAPSAPSTPSAPDASTPSKPSGPDVALSGGAATDPNAVNGAVTDVTSTLSSDGLTPVAPASLPTVLASFQ